MELSAIAPKKGQRALVIGGSRTGKSSLIDMLARHAVQERPNIQELFLDTKPRFRAELERFGPRNKFVRDADHHYEDWEPGPVIPGSIRVNIHADYPLAHMWEDRCRAVILQSEEPHERAELLRIADGWFRNRVPNADRMLVVDELLDFYHANGLCIHPRCNVPLKINRAGGERGFSGLYGAQRPKGIPIQISEELSILYLFHLRYENDMRFLWDMGVPRDIEPPKEEQWAFKIIRISPGGKAEYQGTFRLSLPESYLSQLSDT
jgi:hypothetical protein